jgi:hypothetical protein
MKVEQFTLRLVEFEPAGSIGLADAKHYRPNLLNYPPETIDIANVTEMPTKTILTDNGRLNSYL